MNFKNTRILIILFAIILLAQEGYSQHYNRKFYRKHFSNRGFLGGEKFSFTAGLGTSTYFGDLCDGFHCAKFRPNIGGGIMYRVTPNIGTMLNVNFVRLYSDDYHESRNFQFRSNNLEFLLAGYYQLFAHEKMDYRNKFINPHIYFGVGLMYFNPQGNYNGEWHNLRPLQTEGVAYSSVTPVIPFGAGVNFHLSQSLSVLVEAGYRKTFTDHLDDVSSNTWVSKTQFQNEVAANLANPYNDQYNPGSGQRGNPNKDDWYFVTQVKIRYSIVKKKQNYFNLRRAPLRRRL